MSTNEVYGAARDLKGKVKDGYGGLTGDTVTQFDGKIDQAAGKLQASFGDAADEAAEVAQGVADKASKVANDVGTKLRDTAKTAQAEMRRAGEAVYATGTKVGEAVSETVQSQPLLALLSVAAFGYLASFLIHSPSSPFAPKPRYVPKGIARYLR